MFLLELTIYIPPKVTAHLSFAFTVFLTLVTTNEQIQRG